jgi:hypothetical protein
VLRLAVSLVLTASLCLAVAAAEKRPIKTILDYKTELSLSAVQVQKIREHLSTFRKQLLETRALQRPLQDEVSRLIKEEAPLPEIRQRLTRLAEIQVQSQLQDVVTARSISGLLTKEQLQQWKAIQARRQAQP